MTTALLAFPDRPAAAPPSSGLRGGMAKLAKISRYRRNPRSAEYMRALAAAALPGAEIIEIDGGVPLEPIARASVIVLLWPDATGYGWTTIERAVFGAKRPDTPVFALTGRRRKIELVPGTLQALRLRRFVERSWVGEAMLAAALLATAPFLVAWDFARGHR